MANVGYKQLRRTHRETDPLLLPSSGGGTTVDRQELDGGCFANSDTSLWVSACVHVGGRARLCVCARVTASNLLGLRRCKPVPLLTATLAKPTVTLTVCVHD